MYACSVSFRVEFQLLVLFTPPPKKKLLFVSNFTALPKYLYLQQFSFSQSILFAASSRTELAVYLYLLTTRGHAVVQLVEALRYKSEGRGFDSRWCNWNFSLT